MELIEPSSFGAILFIVAFFVLAIAVVIAIFYIIALRNTLRAIQPQNRKMRPGQAWYLLIPIFGQIYQFLLAGYLADSIAAELRSRGIQPTNPRPTFGIGIAYAVLQLLCLIPVISIITSIPAIILFILHWVKAVEYKHQIEAVPMLAAGDSLIFRESQSA